MYWCWYNHSKIIYQVCYEMDVFDIMWTTVFHMKLYWIMITGIYNVHKEYFCDVDCN